MSLGLSALTYVGSGTPTGAILPQGQISCSPNSSTLPGDLIVVFLYMTGGNPVTDIKDDGLPWKIFGYTDGSNGPGLALMIAPWAGSSGYTFFLSSQATTGATNVATYRLTGGGKFDVGRACLAGGWINTASGTPMDVPAMVQNYSQGLDLLGRGYNTGGTATTCGNITGFTERYDTSYGSASIGLIANDRQLFNAIQNPSVTSSLAAAKDYRMGIRVFVPIIGNTQFPGRMQGPRRILG